MKENEAKQISARTEEEKTANPNIFNQTTQFLCGL
jgi:hypothetical protein